jgi:hypothetical protein
MEIDLRSCKECPVHKGTEGPFVQCGRTKQFTIMVPVTNEKIDCGKDNQ